MRRRATMAAFAFGLLAGAVGCRACGERGWLGHRRDRCDDPCQLVSRGSASCFDGGALPPGATVIGPGAPGMLMPGSGPGPIPAGELPMPGPSGTIPPQGVPYAPPSVAPPPEAGPIGVLPVPQAGVPVRNVK